MYVMHPAGELVQNNLFPDMYGVGVGSLALTISLHSSAAAQMQPLTVQPLRETPGLNLILKMHCNNDRPFFEGPGSFHSSLLKWEAA